MTKQELKKELRKLPRGKRVFVEVEGTATFLPITKESALLLRECTAGELCVGRYFDEGIVLYAEETGEIE